jgi:Flp pilus assembly protein TadG
LQPAEHKLSKSRAASRRGERGNALAEFVLIVGILLLTALGVFEFGRGLHTYVSVVQSAREGARAAMTGTLTDAELQQLVVDAAKPISVTATVTHAGGTTTVTATANFNASLPMVSELWGGGPLVMSRAFTSQ